MMPPAEINTEAHLKRRQRLMAEVGDDAVVAIAAAPVKLRNGDTPYPYRQDSDFFYLTGVDEPEAVLVLTPGLKVEQTLFLRPSDPEKERWDGARLGLDGARAQAGVDAVFAIDEMDERLVELMSGRQSLYYLMGQHQSFEQHLNDLRMEMQHTVGLDGPTTVVSLQPLLHEQRLIKSNDEIKWMKRAAAISADAMQQAMARAPTATSEAQLHAALLHTYTEHGGVPAYQPIVAGGERALVLHYIANNHTLDPNKLVLIDAGCEINGYAADISRTFPAQGRFSGAQKALYEVVLNAQQRAIDAVEVGASYHAFHDAAVRALTDGLIELGLLSGHLDDNIEQATYRRFYMHKTGHWLGLDVHDVGDYRIDDQWRVLEPNMVLTVEPGLYIDHGDDIPAEFQGIGIRIEDDIRITRQGPEVLTQDVPKTVDDIEAWMA